MRIRHPALVAAFLVLLTLVAFWPVTGNEFVNYDDDGYVANNPLVHAGISWRGVRYAFTATAMSNWHPLTWLSHMLDVELFGLDAGRHHLMSLLLHATSAALLFLFLQGATGAVWPSALVAALFAVHPLHVESVAWASERKDVLSTLFWMLVLLAYARHARRPSWRSLAVVTALFALGLLAKPMLVTLPFVLLLLDYWPLRRWDPFGEEAAAPAPKRGRPARQAIPFAQLVVEKIPLFILSAASSAITYRAQKSEGAMIFGEGIEFPLRAANALLSCLHYFRMAVWPANLAPFYPHPATMPPLWQPAAALLTLAGVTAAALWLGRRRCWLAVGWLWYLGTLVPVLGLVQVGTLAMADRYTYVPLIGLFIALAWWLAELAGRRAALKVPLAAAAAVCVAVLAVLARVQAAHWHDSETLFARALVVNPESWTAHNSLGIVLSARGDTEGAIRNFRAAVRAYPRYPDALNNLGVALAAQGKYAEAEGAYRRALEVFPTYTMAHNNLGVALASQGKFEESMEHYRVAIKVFPLFAEAHHNLGVALAETNRLQEAAVEYRAALEINPAHFGARANLGVALSKLGDPLAGARELREAVRLRPDLAEIWGALADALSRAGRRSDAEQAYREALRRNPEFPGARNGPARPGVSEPP